MRLTVVGAGHVGLVVAGGLARAGHDVVVLERDPERVALLRSGRMPMHEPGLAELLGEATVLRFTTEAAEALSACDVVSLCVGTPAGPTGELDLSAMDAAVDLVAAHVGAPTVVAIKSTVPVGTCDRLQGRLPEGVALVVTPEFLREGAAVHDVLHPRRVVIGSRSADATAVVRRMVASSIAHDVPVRECDPPSAELAKLAANAMLATRVSFINEIAALCEVTSADIDVVRTVLGDDPRIGGDYLRPSPGWGGACLPKDVDALLAAGRGHGLPLRVVGAARQANVEQPGRLLAAIEGELEGLAGRRVAVWGLAFKAHTDDVRASVAITLVERLLARGAEVVVHDPRARDAARAVLGDRVRWGADPVDAVQGADALLLCTAWGAYARPDWQVIAAAMRGDCVFDGRNLWSPGAVAAAGLRYRGVGRAVRPGRANP